MQFNATSKSFILFDGVQSGSGLVGNQQKIQKNQYVMYGTIQFLGRCVKKQYLTIKMCMVLYILLKQWVKWLVPMFLDSKVRID